MLGVAGIERALFLNDQEVSVAPQTSEVFTFTDAQRCCRSFKMAAEDSRQAGTVREEETNPDVAGAEIAQVKSQLEKTEGLFKESGLKGMSCEFTDG